MKNETISIKGLSKKGLRIGDFRDAMILVEIGKTKNIIKMLGSDFFASDNYIGRAWYDNAIEKFKQDCITHLEYCYNEHIKILKK